MRYNVYAVYDSVAKAHMMPMYFHNHAQAERSFSDAINDEGSNFNKHPEDYVLTHIGNWDDESGKIEPIEVLETMGTGVKYLRNRDTLQAVNSD